MKLTGLFFTIALFCCELSNAQQTVYSAGFEEPDGLGAKVVQCSNGSTFLFNFTKKEGIEITVYNAEHKMVQHKTITGDGWEPRAMVKSQVDGIYEIKGKMVLFLEQTDDKTPILYRFVFDPVKGDIVEQKKIVEMSRYGAGAGYAMAFGHVDPKTFYVEKDPNSDYYAVIAFDGFAKETEHRIEVIHFDGDNKEINRAFYDSPENNRYKYIRYIASSVNADNNVYLCCYAFNTEATGDKTSKVFFSRLGKGMKQMEHKELSITEDFKDTRGIMVYNEGTKNMDLLTLSYTHSKGGWGTSTKLYYLMLLSIINPENMTVIDSKSLDTKMVNDYRSKYARKGSFAGLPQNMFINPDHSITVVMEEMVTTTTYTNHGSYTMTDLGDVGILELDETGTPKQGYWIPKLQQVKGELPVLWMSLRNKNYQTFQRPTMGFGGYANIGFYSFNYISTNKGRYIIFNDHPDNFGKDLAKSRQNLVAISGANTVNYTFHDQDIKHDYLYGTPPKKDDTRFAYISSGSYSPKTNVYAAMIIDYFGKDKIAKIAWTKFE